MLPCAHMYGLMFELLYELSVGAHVHFLSRVPSPKIIMQALSEVKPYVVIAVPLVIEKIYKNKVKPILEKEGVRFLMKVPGVNQVIMNKIRTELINAFGGEFYEVIIGGAAFNKEVEAFFKRMGFPFTVGYGMTECAPIITYDDWKEEKLYSCGKAAPNMEVRIASADPVNIPGEIQIKGANVFLGYFKNEEATAEVFTEDGWFKTGDLGSMDDEGYVTITGRKKEIIVTAGGKNVAPAVLEDRLRGHPIVSQVTVVGDNRPFIGALITLDADMLPGWLSNKGMDPMSIDEAAENPQVLAALDRAVNRANEAVSRAESIRKFNVLTTDFTVDNDYLTPSLKVKRHKVLTDFAKEIDKIYEK